MGGIKHIHPFGRIMKIIWAFHGLPVGFQLGVGSRSRFRSLQVPAGAMAPDPLILWGATHVCFFQLQKWQLGDYMSCQTLGPPLWHWSIDLLYIYTSATTWERERYISIYIDTPFASQTKQGNPPHARWFSNWKNLPAYRSLLYSLSTISDCRAVLPQKREKKGGESWVPSEHHGRI